MSLLAKTKRLLISTLTTSQAQRLYSFSLRYTLIRWKQPFTANLEFSVPRGDCSRVLPSLRHASRSSSCWSSPTRNLSRRLSSRPAEEPVALKSWKVCWSNSCTTAVASVFSSLVPCTRVWGIWSQSCPSDRTQWALSPSDSNVEAFQIAVAGRQLTAQGARGAGAEHHQGQQHWDGEGHWDAGGLQDRLQGRSRQVLRALGDRWLLKSE